MTPSPILLLLESPERLIRRLAAELDRRDGRGRPKGSKLPKVARSPEEKKLRMRWYAHNARRRAGDLPERSFEEWAALPLLDRGAAKETPAEKEARYQRLKERLKVEPKHYEYRADKLGIRTAQQMKDATMENDSAARHMLDKMVRQEGGSPIFGRRGYHNLFNGAVWATKRRGH